MNYGNYHNLGWNIWVNPYWNALATHNAYYYYQRAKAALYCQNSENQAVMVRKGGNGGIKRAYPNGNGTRVEPLPALPPATFRGDDFSSESITQFGVKTCPECNRHFEDSNRSVLENCMHVKCRMCFIRHNNGCHQCSLEMADGERPKKAPRNSLSSTPTASTSIVSRRQQGHQLAPTHHAIIETLVGTPRVQNGVPNRALPAIQAPNHANFNGSATSSSSTARNQRRPLPLPAPAPTQQLQQQQLPKVRTYGKASAARNVNGNSTTASASAASTSSSPYVNGVSATASTSAFQQAPKQHHGQQRQTQPEPSTSKISPNASSSMQNGHAGPSTSNSYQNAFPNTPDSVDPDSILGDLDMQNSPSNENRVSKKKRNPVHIHEHISIVSGDPLLYQCNVCMKKFKTKAHIKYHEFCQNGEKPFKCEQCGQGFIAKSHYEYHIRTHTGERPYVCPKCGKGFNQRGKVTRHMRSHTGEKPFVCTQCGRGFANAQAMRSHYLIHTGERPFACEFCEKRFTGMTNLKKHVITHTGERPFQCSHCGKSFGLKWTLDLHLRTHSSERPYACEQCSRAFSNSKDLRRHMVIHSGERPFKCWICGTAFRRKDNLDRHIKNTHNQTREVAKQLANEAAAEYLANTASVPGGSSSGPSSLSTLSSASSSSSSAGSRGPSSSPPNTKTATTTKPVLQQAVPSPEPRARTLPAPVPQSQQKSTRQSNPPPATTTPTRLPQKTATKSTAGAPKTGPVEPSVKEEATMYPNKRAASPGQTSQRTKKASPQVSSSGPKPRDKVHPEPKAGPSKPNTRTTATPPPSGISTRSQSMANSPSRPKSTPAPSSTATEALGKSSNSRSGAKRRRSTSNSRPKFTSARETPTSSSVDRGQGRDTRTPQTPTPAPTPLPSTSRAPLPNAVVITAELSPSTSPRFERDNDVDTTEPYLPSIHESELVAKDPPEPEVEIKEENQDIECYSAEVFTELRTVLSTELPVLDSIKFLNQSEPKKRKLNGIVMPNHSSMHMLSEKIEVAEDFASKIEAPKTEVDTPKTQAVDTSDLKLPCYAHADNVTIIYGDSGQTSFIHENSQFPDGCDVSDDESTSILDIPKESLFDFSIAHDGAGNTEIDPSQILAGIPIECPTGKTIPEIEPPKNGVRKVDLNSLYTNGEISPEPKPEQSNNIVISPEKVPIEEGEICELKPLDGMLSYAQKESCLYPHLLELEDISDDELFPTNFMENESDEDAAPVPSERRAPSPVSSTSLSVSSISPDSNSKTQITKDESSQESVSQVTTVLSEAVSARADNTEISYSTEQPCTRSTDATSDKQFLNVKLRDEAPAVVTTEDRVDPPKSPEMQDIKCFTSIVPASEPKEALEDEVSKSGSTKDESCQKVGQPVTTLLTEVDTPGTAHTNKMAYSPGESCSLLTDTTSGEQFLDAKLMDDAPTVVLTEGRVEASKSPQMQDMECLKSIAPEPEMELKSDVSNSSFSSPEKSTPSMELVSPSSPLSSANAETVTPKSMSNHSRIRSSPPIDFALSNFSYHVETQYAVLPVCPKSTSVSPKSTEHVLEDEAISEEAVIPMCGTSVPDTTNLVVLTGIESMPAVSKEASVAEKETLVKDYEIPDELGEQVESAPVQHSNNDSEEISGVAAEKETLVSDSEISNKPVEPEEVELAQHMDSETEEVSGVSEEEETLVKKSEIPDEPVESPEAELTQHSDKEEVAGVLDENNTMMKDSEIPDEPVESSEAELTQHSDKEEVAGVLDENNTMMKDSEIPDEPVESSEAELTQHSDKEEVAGVLDENNTMMKDSEIPDEPVESPEAELTQRSDKEEVAGVLDENNTMMKGSEIPDEPVEQEEPELTQRIASDKEEIPRLSVKVEILEKDSEFPDEPVEQVEAGLADSSDSDNKEVAAIAAEKEILVKDSEAQDEPVTTQEAELVQHPDSDSEEVLEASAENEAQAKGPQSPVEPVEQVEPELAHNRDSDNKEVQVVADDEGVLAKGSEIPDEPAQPQETELAQHPDSNGKEAQAFSAEKETLATDDKIADEPVKQEDAELIQKTDKDIQEVSGYDHVGLLENSKNVSSVDDLDEPMDCSEPAEVDDADVTDTEEENAIVDKSDTTSFSSLSPPLSPVEQMQLSPEIVEPMDSPIKMESEVAEDRDDDELQSVSTAPLQQIKLEPDSDNNCQMETQRLEDADITVLQTIRSSPIEELTLKIETDTAHNTVNDAVLNSEDLVSSPQPSVQLKAETEELPPQVEADDSECQLKVGKSSSVAISDENPDEEQTERRECLRKNGHLLPVYKFPFNLFTMEGARQQLEERLNDINNDPEIMEDIRDIILKIPAHANGNTPTQVSPESTHSIPMLTNESERIREAESPETVESIDATSQTVLPDLPASPSVQRLSPGPEPELPSPAYPVLQEDAVDFTDDPMEVALDLSPSSMLSHDHITRSTSSSPLQSTSPKLTVMSCSRTSPKFASPSDAQLPASPFAVQPVSEIKESENVISMNAKSESSLLNSSGASTLELEDISPPNSPEPEPYYCNPATSVKLVYGYHDGVEQHQTQNLNNLQVVYATATAQAEESDEEAGTPRSVRLVYAEAFGYGNSGRVNDENPVQFVYSAAKPNQRFDAAAPTFEMETMTPRYAPAPDNWKNSVEQNSSCASHYSQPLPMHVTRGSGRAIAQSYNHQFPDLNVLSQAAQYNTLIPDWHVRNQETITSAYLQNWNTGFQESPTQAPYSSASSSGNWRGGASATTNCVDGMSLLASAAAYREKMHDYQDFNVNGVDDSYEVVRERPNDKEETVFAADRARVSAAQAIATVGLAARKQREREILERGVTVQQIQISSSGLSQNSVNNGGSSSSSSPVPASTWTPAEEQQIKNKSRYHPGPRKHYLSSQPRRE